MVITATRVISSRCYRLETRKANHLIQLTYNNEHATNKYVADGNLADGDVIVEVDEVHEVDEKWMTLKRKSGID